MFANVKRERERDWCRHVKVNIASADRQVERERERERERDVCVSFLNFVRFFLLWELVYVFQKKKNNFLPFVCLFDLILYVPSTISHLNRKIFLD